MRGGPAFEYVLKVFMDFWESGSYSGETALPEEGEEEEEKEETDERTSDDVTGRGTSFRQTHGR